jgi:uncharacterized protein DUF3658
MNREQAVRIQAHLLDAHLALDDARMVIAGLCKEERLRLNGSLWEVIAALQQKLLAPIHEQFPDIEPPVIDEEIPTISSELRWDQVRLPPSVTESGIDGIIFSALKPRWQKTAMVIGLAVQRCRELDLPIADEAIAARLQALSDSDRIEGIGDLRMWRHSEVRLRD